MKKNYILSLALIFFVLGMNSQIIIEDDMESYTDGSTIFQGHWTDWDDSGNWALYSSSAQAHSGVLSGYVPGDGTTDAVLNLGNQTFGPLGLSFWMYVPSGKEAYFNFQGAVPIPADPYWSIGNIHFNQDLASPGEGVIDYSTSTETEWTNFSFPHDQWFQIIVNVNAEAGMSTSTFQFIVDGVMYEDWRLFASINADGVYEAPVSLGGIDFFSITTDNEYWVDDIVLQFGYIADTAELENKGFAAYPNPVKDVLNLRADENIDNVVIFNMLGQKVYSVQPNSITYQLDMSSFENGAYFVKVAIGDTEGTTKVIK